MEFNIKHKEQTDEESYKNIKKLHEENPDLIIGAEEWRKLRMEELKRLGLRWSE